MIIRAKNRTHALIIGRGQVGQALNRIIFDTRKDWFVPAIVGKSDINLYGGGHQSFDQVQDWGLKRLHSYLKGIRKRIVFLAISTEDEGEAAARYIDFFVRNGVSVVTSEKGSLAFHHDRLRNHLPRIGYRATVGCSSGLLPFVRDHLRLGHQDTEIDAVVNASLNLISCKRLYNGFSIEAAVGAAIERGFIERNSGNPYQVVCAEIRDTMLKVCIMFNLGINNGRSRLVLHPTDLKLRAFTREDFTRVMFPDTNCYRYVVHFTTRCDRDDYDMIGGFSAKVGDWRIYAGFRPAALADRPDEEPWLPRDEDNAVRIQAGGNNRRKLLTGPGADPHETARSMLCDAERLLE